MDQLKVDVGTIRQASRQVVRELGFLEDRLFDLGISHSQSHTLLELDRQGLLTLQELGSQLRLEKSTMSRVGAALIQKGLVRIEMSGDKRLKPLSLTPAGKKLVSKIHEISNRQVAAALANLPASEREMAIHGMSIYAKALSRTRTDISFEIRPIEKSDNSDVARVIRKVMPEFGAGGPGFAIHDPEVSEMFESYRNSKSAYFVLLHKGRIAGGGGIAPLEGGDQGTCELRKMYLLPEARGFGYGQKILDRCLEKAQELGYRECYLETLTSMAQAKLMYEKNGFVKLSGSMGNTGHFGCDSWYLKQLVR